ncbi:MAG: hypothetical protein KDA54_01590 [Phycisphaerales bacterium]|nr:hypothetical protein [Phycisphaerales bacterium]
MADEITDAILDSATGPKRAQGDAGSVEQHSLKDQIEADKYLASKTATASAGIGIKLVRLSPPGTA